MKKNKKINQFISLLLLSSILTLSSFSILASIMVNAQEQEKVFFTVELLSPIGDKVRESVGALLAEELPKIGIGVELEYNDWATLMPKVIKASETGLTADQGGYDMHLMATMQNSVDPTGFEVWFSSKYYRPIGNGQWHYFDPKIDALLEEGRTLTTIEERQPVYWELVEYIKDKAFCIEMYHPTWYGIANIKVENAEQWNDVAGYGTYEARYWRIAGKTEADDTSVVYGLITDINNLIESLSIVTYDSNIHYLMFDALIHNPWTIMDPKYNDFMPNLAESWEISDDSLTYTFHLRDDVKWHDGVPFTSKDVKFTYDAIMNPETAAAESQYWRDFVESIEAPDDYTVVVRFKEKMHTAFEYLFRRMIMPEHILGEVPLKDWGTSPYNTGDETLPGTGPYKLVNWQKGEYFEFEAYDDYHGGRPFIDKFFIKIIPDTVVGISALEAGEVDVLPAVYGLVTEYDRLEKNPDLKFTIPDPIHCQQLHINCNHPILNNINVRKAISYAIPRQHIVTDLALGWAEPASQWPAPSRTWAYNPNLEVTPYDLEKARDYMEKAGYLYEWLEPDVIPISAYYLPAAISLIIGAVVGSIATYKLKK